MTTFEEVRDIAPAARAAAEVRAREAGMSLSEWLEALVYEKLAPAPIRRNVFYGGGAMSRSDHVGGSKALSVAVHPGDRWDIDMATYVPMLRYPGLENSHLSRIFLSSEAHIETWSALQTISAFPPRISHAAILLSAAFAEADVAFRLPAHRPRPRHKPTSRWYHDLVDTCLHRSHEVRNALAHDWTPSGRAERLWGDAFFTLCDLTPARRELLLLFQQDRSRASLEMVKHLEVATQQFELSASLLPEVEAPPAAVSDALRFRQLRDNLLQRAGGGLSLTQGAELLRITRQALHKRIKAGTALGMMDGDELVLPRLQFDETGEKAGFVKGLSDVVRLFERSGGWSALQFLIERDPNVGLAPIDALNSGRVEAVLAAARGYLGLDEG